MSFRSVQHGHETTALPASVMTQAAVARVVIVAAALALLWSAIVWAVALP